jgi:hypothetical protein
MKALDQTAMQSLEDREWKELHAEELQEDARQFQQLMEEPSLAQQHFPSWWVVPQLIAISLEECQDVKRLLNDVDFRDEIMSLASDQIHMMGWAEEMMEDDDDCLLEVDLAAVASVGPAGLWLRAQVRQVTRDSTVEDRTAIVDLPIAFSQPSQTMEELRSSVLGLVAAAAAVAE